MSATILNKGSFQQVIENGVTLVDFYASWCAPCKVQLPIVDELAEDFAGKATIAKVNVEEQSELAAQFGISSMPTLVLFKDGTLIDTMVGLKSKDVLKARLEEAIGHKTDSCGCSH